MIGDVILLQSGVVYVNRRGPLFFCDKGVFSARFKEEPGQENMLAGGGAHIAAHLKHTHQACVVIVQPDEVIEISLYSVREIVLYGFIELLLEFVRIAFKRELTPMKGIRARHVEAHGSFYTSIRVNGQVRDALRRRVLVRARGSGP